MKNLKKTLCLVLTIAMLMSMMIFTTSAANFTDNDEIVNTDAVNMMNALNIINGKGDGSYFDPAGIVTRAEMAKMICVALNGGKDPNLGTTAYSFTDTVGNWAAGYIEYCYNLGIVSGRGDGTFNPTGTVTGTEAAKMLLVAIGYDSANEGFTGASWALNVNILASAKGFYTDLAINASAGLTRDNAAQMVYNAISANKVSYTYQLNTVNGNLVSVPVAQDVTTFGKTTILLDKFSLTTVKGILDGVSYNKDTGKYTYSYTTTAAGVAFPNGTAGATLASTKTDYTGFYGHYVKILYKAGTTENTIYGMYDASGLTVKTTIGDLASVTGSPNKVSVGSTKYNTTAAYGSVPGYVFDSNTAALTTAGTNKSIGGLTAGSAGAGSYDNASTVILVSSDSNTTIDYAVVIPTTVAKVTYVSSTAITAGTNYTIADHNVDSGLVKGDFVTIVAAANSFQNPKATIAKATLISGTIDGNKNTSDVLVNGTWYKLAKNTGDAIELGEVYNVAVVGGFYYNLEKTSTGASMSTVLYVSAAENATTLNKVQAKAYLTDGTNEIIKVAKYSNTGTANLSSSDPILLSSAGAGAANTALANKFFTYSVDSSGNYLLTEVNASNKIGMNTIVTTPTAFAAATSSTDAKLGIYTIADDAVIFVKDKDGYSVITGDALNDWSSVATLTSQVVTKSVNGLPVIKLAFVNVGSISAPSGITGNYGYVVSSPYSVKDGTNTYKKFEMWNGNATETVIDKGSVAIAKGNIVTYTDKGNNYVEVTSATAVAAAIQGFSEKSISVVASDGTVNSYNRTNKTVYMYIDTKAVAGVSSGEIAVADTDTNGSRFQNMYYILSSSDYALVVYDVNNKFENASTTYGYVPNTGLTVAAATVSDTTNFNVTTDRTRAMPNDTITVTVTAKTAAGASYNGLNCSTLNGTGAAVSPAATTTILTGASTIGSTYTFTITMGTAAITAITISATPITVVLAGQSGTITSANTTPESATFAVTTTGIGNGNALTPTITWYTASASGTVTTAPAGVTASATPVSSNSSTVTVTDTATSGAATPGNYYFTVTVGGVESTVQTLTIS